jgi:hypothetical protein
MSKSVSLTPIILGVAFTYVHIDVYLSMGDSQVSVGHMVTTILLHGAFS